MQIVHCEPWQRLASVSFGRRFLKFTQQHQVGRSPTPARPSSSRARRATERQEVCIPPGPKVLYRPSHTLFLFFSHRQPPTNNTRKGSALCLDDGVSLLSVLIRRLIQQHAWRLTRLAWVREINQTGLRWPLWSVLLSCSKLVCPSMTTGRAS